MEQCDIAAIIKEAKDFLIRIGAFEIIDVYLENENV